MKSKSHALPVPTVFKKSKKAPQLDADREDTVKSVRPRKRRNTDPVAPSRIWKGAKPSVASDTTPAPTAAGSGATPAGSGDAVTDHPLLGQAVRAVGESLGPSILGQVFTVQLASRKSNGSVVLRLQGDKLQVRYASDTEVLSFAT